MTIRDLIDQFEIQGGYCIKKYDYEEEDYIIFAKGHDFECERHKEQDLNRNITYMYAVNGVLNIEVE